MANNENTKSNKNIMSFESPELGNEISLAEMGARSEEWLATLREAADGRFSSGNNWGELGKVAVNETSALDGTESGQ